MNNNSILLVNPDYNPELNQHYSLVLRTGFDTFSYLIIDKENQQLLALYDEQECQSSYGKFIEKSKHDPYLQIPFKETTLAFLPQDYQLVPEEIYEDSQINAYLNFFNTKGTKQIFVSDVFNQKIKTIFSLPSSVSNTIQEKFSNAQLTTQSSGLLDLIAKTKEEQILVDFTVNSFQLIYINNGQLQFHQNFEFENTDELNYYILLTANQLKINTHHIQLKLSGIIHPDDEKWNNLKNYFNDIQLLELEVPYNISILEDMPLQYYSSLLALI